MQEHNGGDHIVAEIESRAADTEAGGCKIALIMRSGTTRLMTCNG